MEIKKDPVDIVIVGFGWTGSLMAMELANTGLKIVALERGEKRDTYPDFAYPRIADELTYGIRLKLFQNISGETITVRHKQSDTALPYRRLGSFLPGNGVGGAGVHWNGMLWRPLHADIKMRSTVIEKYGADFIPSDMTVQDYPFSYEEMEPYFDKFEKICGTSGQAGNINGKILDGGNPFESERKNPYPTKPLKMQYSSLLFNEAAKSLGYHPFPTPSANCTEPYVNPYGVQLGVCNYCGYCERFGCFNYSKASPQACVLPALRQHKNIELRTNSHVVQVNMDSTGKKATGVTYIDSHGQRVVQPADLVILSAFQLHNVRLLLLSNIGKPYNPTTGEGVVGRNFAYQMNGGVTLFYDQNQFMNPFAAAGCTGSFIDNYNAENFDHSQLGFIGGSTISTTTSGGRPIQQMTIPKDSPTWGTGWKKAIKENYLHSMHIGASGSVMPYKQCYLDLDPTYQDKHGLPLLRMTFDWQPNELKMTSFVGSKAEEITKRMNPKHYEMGFMSMDAHYDVRPYQSTHTTGGAVMGDSPQNSVVNKYMQTWDVPNVFVLGACCFPQNLAYNPTGIVGATALFAANAIRELYLPNPGPLVQA
ncbi:GMC family oxidoreductase [Providencia rettgeri]|uniref:GMC family oxidoreductase n=1 Tax=Providencia TaxID=586 RepID=UPI001419FADC|nr:MULTISPECIES: GMC family oxidoreductase [Providencia]EIL1983405.1 GMC family oxidoreductase [Providencia rettgeri]EIU9516150.1 GMC family oxidoreductase [Providencia rettgeri]EJD6369063.1 GMC family oxidoreductase [Providencia rettgeri]EJD6373899.1 GMC family oxidoreductase [Providencia rettgeri]ELR5031615.1 GMC family oxidoreductase [Providencia rettgeri]